MITVSKDVRRSILTKFAVVFFIFRPGFNVTASNSSVAGIGPGSAVDFLSHGFSWI